MKGIAVIRKKIETEFASPTEEHILDLTYGHNCGSGQR